MSSTTNGTVSTLGGWGFPLLFFFSSLSVLHWWSLDLLMVLFVCCLTSCGHEFIIIFPTSRPLAGTHKLHSQIQRERRPALRVFLLHTPSPSNPSPFCGLIKSTLCAYRNACVVMHTAQMAIAQLEMNGVKVCDSSTAFDHRLQFASPKFDEP